MKKIILSAFTILLVSALSIGATMALFSDEEVSEGNTFTAGSLDLTVGDDVTLPFTAEGLVPGESSTACVVLTNNGSVDGQLTLAIDNPVSNENGLFEPEEVDGDIDGQEVDPTSYDANGGDGELWDQLGLKFFIDENGNEEHDWGEASTDAPNNAIMGDGLDLTSAQHVALGENLFPLWKLPVGSYGNYEHVMAPDDNASFCMSVTFKNGPFDGRYGGLTNNMAMSDDVVFDVIFGLEQII